MINDGSTLSCSGMAKDGRTGECTAEFIYSREMWLLVSRLAVHFPVTRFFFLIILFNRRLRILCTMRWLHLGAPVFEPQMQVQSHLEPAPYMRFGFGPLAAPHPEPGVRCGFGAGSGGSKTGPRPV